MSFVTESTECVRVMALLFISDSVAVGGTMILEAIRVILYSLFLSGMDSIVIREKNKNNK